MKNYITQLQKITLAITFSLLSFSTIFAQAETAKIKDGTVSNGATKAKDGSIFELESNNKGMLISRLTTAQRDAIPASNLSNGLLVYNINSNCFDYWDALRIQWLSMCGTPPPAVFDISSIQCSAIVANGTYKQGENLNAANTLTIPVTVTQPGTYTITATTANGYYFETSGNFPSANTYELTLKGTGRPNTGYTLGESGDSVSVILNGVVNSCNPHIFVEKANVDFSVSCADITALGSYNIGIDLTTENKMTVKVNVTNLGFWSIKTNTVNGYAFNGSGTFTALGTQTVELLGTGKPVASGTDVFSVSSNASTAAGASCSGIPVTVATVAYTMNCAAATQSGAYMQNVALTNNNTITLPVNVTATGNTTITTNTVNGVSFSSGPIALTALGTQNVVLKGSGAPLSGATSTLTLTGTPGAASTCDFNLVIAAQPVAYTMNCSGITTAGSYAPSTTMTSSNTMSVPVTVSYVGDYSISTNTVNGVTFSKTGTFTTTGAQTVTLDASGTPTAGGTFTYTISSNSASSPMTCSKSITFVYRTMKVLGLGDGIYQPGTASTSQAARAILASAANFGPNGVVKSDPIQIINGNNSNGNALKTLINNNNIDIIVIAYSYDVNLDAATRKVLADFVNIKKGVLIHSQELFPDTNKATINAIIGGGSSANVIGIGTHINKIMQISDPVLDGPFLDLKGKLLGTDATTTCDSATNLPSDVIVLATTSNNSSNVFAFRHSTKGYLWCGDAGFIAGNSSNSSGDIYPGKISSAGAPLSKSYTGGVVYNSYFYANAMAWAIQYAQANKLDTKI